MSKLGWARSTGTAADVLRRGAWYPILEKTDDGQAVVVQVDERPVRVSRIEVQVRDEPPHSWCVVQRSGVMRPTWSGARIATVYAVCPNCRERQEFEGRPTELNCARCKKSAPVDWEDKC